MNEHVPPLSETLVGSWSLVSRVVETADGERVPTHLGDDPVALLIYDRHGNFSAQFMKRDRDGDETLTAAPGAPARNNTGAIGGYDAYFGTYTVDDARGAVTQTLLGSLSPSNVGQVLTRTMSVDGDELRIEVETTTTDGRDAVIFLTWRRSSG